MTATIAGSGRALPPPMSQDLLWNDFFRAHYGDARVARQVWRSSGIETRRGVVNPTVEDVSRWGTSDRMRRFLAEAVPLGKEAVGQALGDAAVSADEIGLFTVVSSTGYVAPGLDIILARDLGMAPDVQRLHIGHMGCYAALPALGAATDFVTSRARPALVLSLELTSLHVQPAAATASSGSPTKEDCAQMVAHALFSDAAAAVVLQPGETRGLEVVDVVAHTEVATAAEMTWDVTDQGFRMGLSPQVPDLLARHVRPVVESMLTRRGLAPEEISGWAIHPGGRRVVEAVGSALDLADEHLDPAYAVLRETGNCSSATVLLVLDRVLATRNVAPGGWVVAMTFGPGLTIYTALLRLTP
jgi:predicted naringenin-chalcone synthase